VPAAGAARDGENTTRLDSWQSTAARGAAAGLAVAALSFALLQGRASAGEARAAAAPRGAPTTQQTVFTAPSLAVVAGDTQGALKYRLLQLFAAPTYGKVLAVVTVAAPILLLGSFLYRKTARGETPWSEAFIRPYSVLLNCPGARWAGQGGRGAGGLG
jgi:hypothetical protein